MHSDGLVTVDSWQTAEIWYEGLAPVAQTIVRELARSMEFDRAEYNNRVSTTVVETARNAMFASLLEVKVGTKADLNKWQSEIPYDVVCAGSEHVDNAAWHNAPFADQAVAVTFQNEPDAAVGTLRRMAFNRIYRPEFYGESTTSTAE